MDYLKKWILEKKNYEGIFKDFVEKLLEDPPIKVSKEILEDILKQSMVDVLNESMEVFFLSSFINLWSKFKRKFKRKLSTFERIQ